MSSRALRKAQREREQLELEKQQLEVQKESSEEDDDGEAASAPLSKPSAFEMLGHLNDEAAEEDEDAEEEEKQDNQEEQEDGQSIHALKPSAKRRQQGNKKKKKNRQNQQHPDSISEQGQGILDSFEGLKIGKEPNNTPPAWNDAEPDAQTEVCRLLSIDTNHLIVSNEMRRLFGRAAFEGDQEERADQSLHARANQSQQHIGLVEAVTGRMSVGGAGLSAALRRRNIFAQGKEEWPRQTSNGLSMEVESTTDSGIITYRFVHTQLYQAAQFRFQQAVDSMESSNLITLIMNQPYHIGTLLQVSEIAKQEGKHSTRGELLERALFAFGKALPPSFSTKLAQGKARLRYGLSENREFFLTVWHYIHNVSMRGTWRTAFEWAKLLLSLDPEGDHQCVRLVIDQFALRAKQGQSFLNLVESKFFKQRWSCLPNIGYSKSLAARMTDTNLSLGSPSELLTDAILHWPWVAVRLYEELGIDKVPPGIWGTSAGNDRDGLHSKLYAMVAQDLWKVPEAKAFLMEAAAGVPEGGTKDKETLFEDQEISLDEARFVILTDKPSLIEYLPRSITSRLNSMSDPLPPHDSINTAVLPTPEQLFQESPRRFVEAVRETEEAWNAFLPLLGGLYADEREHSQLLRTVAATASRPGRNRHEAEMESRRQIGLAETFVHLLLEQDNLTIVGANGERAWLESRELRNATLRTSLPEDPPGRYDGPEEQARTTGGDDEAAE